MSLTELPEYVDGVPNVSGNESVIDTVIADSRDKPLYVTGDTEPFGNIRAAAAIALHQHQPLIPAGGNDLQTAALISNLQHMWENQHIGDNHNAPTFAWCYKRIGEFVPELVDAGKNPRCMLEYSGTLLHGLRHMGQGDVVDALKHITTNPDYRHCIEWLGMPWGHAVAPSTPIQDYKLHVKAFQHHFAAIFGLEALERLRGFSPSEMALPNQPDVAYEYVKTLVEAGYQWVLIQEHTVEHPEDGHHPKQPHIPNRLVLRNSDGDEIEILALIKTQGSDTKLVAQMQPYYEAQSLQRTEVAGISVPPLVTQIADGENGGVMMNEFPPKFKEVVHTSSWTDTPLMNGSEYIEHLFAAGVKRADLPVIQPVQQKKIWDRVEPGVGKEKMDAVIEALKKEDHQFHMDGGSWTDDISWVKGYDNVLMPMDRASRKFYEKVIEPGIASDDARYRNALYHLLASQTSCYRYWGQGVWTDYGAEIPRRVIEICDNDFA